MATTEYWFNEKEQKLFEKRARGTDRKSGDFDKDGNAFIWYIDPRNRYTIKSEWLNTLLANSPVKPVIPETILWWAEEVEYTADKCLPKDDFRINRDHYNPLPMTLLINRYGSLGGKSERYMTCSVMFDVDGTTPVKMGEMPLTNDSPDKMWINMYHDGYGAFHSEPVIAFKKGYPSVKFAAGKTWNGWIIQGAASSLIDIPIGYMLESIATTSATNPTPGTTVKWFREIKDLITRCYEL